MQKRFSVLPRDIFLSGCYYYNKKAERGVKFPADDCAGAEWNATGKKEQPYRGVSEGTASDD